MKKLTLTLIFIFTISIQYLHARTFSDPGIKLEGSSIKNSPAVKNINKSIAKKTGKTKKIGDIEFAFIKGGSFSMGSKDAYSSYTEKPVHKVTVAQFYMSIYEVTQKQYFEIMGKNYSNFKGENLPVEKVTWYDAVEFCNKLSIKNGLNPYYKINKDINDPNYNYPGVWRAGEARYMVSILGGNGFHLPTEAEWEYACRAGTSTKYYWGDKINGDYCWYGGNGGNSDEKTHPVGEKIPNTFGLYDMSGNVSEWCWDWFGPYSKDPSKNPQGALMGETRVIRGGSWDDDGNGSNVSIRFNNCPGKLSDEYGIRVIISRIP